MTDQNWPLFEVFPARQARAQPRARRQPGTLPTPRWPLHHAARPLHPAQRRASASGWSGQSDITASSPDEKDPFFKPSGDKVVPPTRRSTTSPTDVPHM